MLSEFNTISYIVLDIWYQLGEHLIFFVWLIPLVLMYEMPLMIIVVGGILRWYYTTFMVPQKTSLFKPKVSCVITCYAEGAAVKSTIDSFVEQTYDGEIEIIAVVDGAVQNGDTYRVAMACAKACKSKNRRVIVLPKWQRGGRVSTLNAGLSMASGEIVINADADTSFDNDMVNQVVPYFEDPNVPALGGALRVRNITESIWTRMQSIEYLISMQGGKTGLAQWNLLNNISGAFGVFRRDFLMQIGGWDTHTAEDLDLTVRIKQYFKRHPNWKIPFATLAIGHTDAPADLKTLVMQRLRWDGDLLFLYFRKHWPAFTPKLLGWGTFLFTLFYGFLQNVLMPFIIVLYGAGIILLYPWQFIASISTVIYSLYSMVLVFFYLLVLLAISERPKQDLRLAIWLPLYPFYALFMRLVCFFALINEVVRRSHEESSMAPWWVLKRGRKF
ncbi:N-acetylglucosaminyltransferase [Shewanella sp. Choline-02u-19]|uniref:glycosyltransferase family 2 protein n=1 Tax=unclassified Shewanella TaxID=196818 RepID=UPI000C348AC5|nr:MULTISPECIES: glycosyltransferase [unclassified Shewanella]PKG57866.1 N-acetylglucosaminyltransferase [Shewanella sp. GutDb-MelDb]PKG76045.1 N-acetylglucosaminyltransferase [Shewanella sp. GutCb]PKH56674.1 N-acetylglucosaminyltransferase [Shewanella sp. Bg11-22]PKI30225.1 N-acetylglucosaminyltransferase [Shewanella sp. Choline-02u-19]